MSEPMSEPMSEIADRPEVAPVRPGEELDWDALRAYLREHVPELDGDMEVEQFPNGSANLTYRVRLGDTRVVLRRPPFGQIAPGAHDMKREFTACSALNPHFDRAPRPYVFCNDHSVVGSDFIVVEYREGVGVWGKVPSSMTHHREAGRRMGFAIVEAMADLHVLDPEGVGLGGLGKPDGFVGRQVSGWSKRWDLVDAGRIPAMTDVTATLTATMPAQNRQVSVLHNDLKPDNCQWRPENPDRVYSIFDWDMATIGDPLVDLGTLLNYWPDPSDTPEDSARAIEGLDKMGLPSRAEVVERYAERTGFDVSTVRWYEAFATWKTIVVLEQLYQRFVRGESTDQRMADLGEPGPRMANRVARILETV
jgi:aminoglycoside phosphotransferase (APT) family kinase protein